MKYRNSLGNVFLDSEYSFYYRIELENAISDQSVENNLAGQIALNEGDAVAWRLDLVHYAQMVMSMVSLGGQTPLGEMMDGLSELEIPPVTGKVRLGNGRLSSEMRIPVESIKAGFDYFESAQQAALE